MVSIPVSDAFSLNYVDFASSRQEYDGVVRIAFEQEDTTASFSGTLLYTGRHILTAAHAIPTTDSVSSYTVQFSENGAFTNVGVTNISTHSGFVNANPYNNDIAVITLSSDAPIWADRHSVYSLTDEIGQTFVKVGFGIAGTGAAGVGSNLESNIRRVGENTFDILADSIRSNASAGTQLAYDFDNGLTANDALGQTANLSHIGLGSREVGSTSGDSGGPGLINGRIASVVSSGGGNISNSIDVVEGVNSSFGEVFFDTRASAYIDFIEAAVGQSNPSQALAPRVIVETVETSGISSDYYLAQNVDVKNAGINAVSHYVNNGANEGRDPNPYFDSSGYLSVYTDVAQAGVDGLTHYILNGWKEGRDPSKWFDTSQYLETHSDVAAAGINPLLHYLQTGDSEGRDVFYSEDAAWLAIV